MKAKEIQRLCRKYVMPYLPGYELKGRMLIATPIGHYLRAFSFEPSGFDKTVYYLEVFLQPMYVPLEYVAFTFGTRLRPGEITPENEGDEMARVVQLIEEKGLPFLDTVRQPSDLVQHRGLTSYSGMEHRLTAIAYAAILADDCDKAFEVMDEVTNYMSEGIREHHEIDWYRDLVNQIDHVRQTLRRSPQETIDLLYEWRRYTISSLKLEQYAMPNSILRPLSGH